MIHRRVRTSLLVAAAVVAGVVTPVASAVAAPASVPGGAAGGGPTITLLTGDEVTIGGPRGVSVRMAKGREHISFHVRKDVEGDTHVIPDDAFALLGKGKLDPRLFDVTELAEAGHGDRLPLIVDYAGPTPRSAAARVSRELPTMGATAVSVERSAAYWPVARKAEHVWLDGPVRASLDRSVAQIGAPEAWQAGLTGAGTTVAVLDTGIDVTHPDLADAVIGAANFTDTDSELDRFGHGTHVASIVTGNGARYRGVAPDAKLLNGKVLDDNGFGSESSVIAGMEWAVGNGADVINMSLGGQIPSDGTDPMSQAVNRLTEETGALFVVAAGNSGGLVTSPAAADAALTVGAVDRDEQLADFSSHGRMDGGIKPEITAPGVGIVAAAAANGQVGTPVEDGYVSMSGTSMAAPHVSGAAAILAGQHPDWAPDQLRSMLVGSAEPNGTLTAIEQGAGRVDVATATTSTVFASPASLNNGVTQWPHDDDQPIAKTLTYTNTGAEPVTFDLTTGGDGPDGSPAPQGMFTVEPAQLTVPAGGQASATVTTDTKLGSAHGIYSGVVTATGDGRSVRTPVAVNREAETYEVTMRFVDPTGAPTAVYFAWLVDVNNPVEYMPYDESGTVKIRLPRGEYYFQGALERPNEEGEVGRAQFVEPALDLTHDIDLVLDAREVEPVEFQLDKPNAKAGGWTDVEFERETAWGTTGGMTVLLPNGVDGIRPATTSSDKFTLTAESRLAEWNGTSFAGSPYLYFVHHKENGTVPQTLRWRYQDRQFAKVRSEHAAATPGATGVRENFLPIPLPSTLTEYYTPDVPWISSFAEVTDPNPPAVAVMDQIEPKTYRLGRPSTVRWNFGVYGPALPAVNSVARKGDLLFLDPSMVVDQGRGRVDFDRGEGSTTLLRGGDVIATLPTSDYLFADVGPERAVYTLHRSRIRTTAWLSTRIDAAWTFASEHVTEEQYVGLPLLAVRFAPALDDHNAAPAGRFTIPVYVQRNGTSEVGQVNTPSVEVSYDDGTTWQPATVSRHRDEWKATVNHPQGAEFVSLRSSISDPDGNTQQQTIIRAYALK
jgi:subtilisin family serine protease